MNRSTCAITQRPGGRPQTLINLFSPRQTLTSSSLSFFLLLRAWHLNQHPNQHPNPASEVSIRSQHPKSASEARARCQVSRPQNPIPDPQGQGEGRDDCVNIEFPSIRTQIPHNPIFQTRLEGDLDRIRMTHNLSPESFDILLHAFAILLIFVCLCFIDLALFFSAALLLHFALSCVHLDGRTPR
jgi:hypothetical protein